MFANGLLYTDCWCCLDMRYVILQANPFSLHAEYTLMGKQSHPLHLNMQACLNIAWLDTC